MNKTILFLSFIIILSFSVFAQIFERDKLYDDSQVARIDIYMAQSALDSMLTYTHLDSVYRCSIHFKNKYFDENVSDVAVRVRGNTSRDAQKKSIKLDFNEYIDNRYFHSVSSLNINGEHNDPSIVRSKLGWDFFQKIGVTASRAAHTELYINGKYYGLYISIEAVNKAFLKNNYSDASGNLWKCLWPADLNYLGDDPNLYKLTNEGRRVYELGTNEETDDYSELARFIKIANRTPDTALPDSLEKIFYLPELLKYYAVDELFGSWDEYWYLKNNYYLYNEPNTKKIHIIPYDYDNCLGVDWFNIDWATINPYSRPFSEGSNYARPLVTRVMANKQYRNLYTHFLQFYNNLFALANWGDRIDSIKQKLLPFASADTLRTKDYGFTLNDFINSYSLSGYSNQHVKRGIKEFVNTRNVTLPGQLSLYSNQKPIVYDIKFYPQNPGPADTIFVYASMFCKETVSAMKINYINNNTQSNTEYNMAFSPVPNTNKVEEADRWIGKIPPLGAGGNGKFIITVKDSAGNISNFPRYEWINVSSPSAIHGNVVINEILAKNVTGITDEAGDHEDWLELYNTSNEQVDLSGKFLTSDKDRINLWKIPQGTGIAPKGYLLVWCDKESAEGPLHASFKLSQSGELVSFIDSDSLTILDSIHFPAIGADTSYGRYPDGGINWKIMQPSPLSQNTNVMSVNDSRNMPKGFQINAYPNPFNPTVNIKYNIPRQLQVRITIYDALGREVFSIDKGNQKPGSYIFLWNGKNSQNESVSSGIYFCRITAGDKNMLQKLMLIK